MAEVVTLHGYVQVNMLTHVRTGMHRKPVVYPSKQIQYTQLIGIEDTLASWVPDNVLFILAVYRKLVSSIAI